MLRHAKWQFAVPTWLSNNCKVMCFKMISIWVYSLLWKVCGRGLTWFLLSHRDSTAAFHFGQVGSIVWIDHINGTARVNAWILHVQRLNCDTTRHHFLGNLSLCSNVGFERPAMSCHMAILLCHNWLPRILWYASRLKPVSSCILWL
jgi:hypothetical protein